MLTDEIGAPVPVEAVEWATLALPDPSAPDVVVPADWRDEVAAPFPCRGLPPLTSAMALSPEGDYTVSLRVGYWAEPLALDPAGTACGGGATGRYSYGVEYLGVRYVVEGGFVELPARGTLQLELVTPETKHGFVRELGRAWIVANREAVR